MRSLSSLAAVSIVVFTAPLLAQSDTCLSHIQESGSVFTGKVIESYQEFPGIDKETALRRLEALLPDAAGVTIASVDAEAGTIKGERRDPLLSHPFPIAFTVSSTASGVRVQLWLKTLPGQIPVGRFKHEVVKAEMGDKVIIDKINASPGDKLDTSTDALIRLKKAGVSKAIIDGMIKRGEGE